MYGLPKDVDLSFFRGKELIQVAVGPFDVQLNFHEDVGVAIQSRIEHTSRGSTTIWQQGDTPPTAAASLLTLIGNSVVSAVGAADGTLTLEFSNSDTVRVFDTEGYEAYQIYNKDEHIYV